MKIKALFILHLVLSFMLSSCEHKDLCYHHPHYAKIAVDFDWSNHPADKKPEGMRVIFYPISGGENWIFDFPQGIGSTIEIPENHYRVVSYNYDISGVILENSDDCSSFMAVTKSVKAPDGATSFSTPSWVCGDNIVEIDLTDIEPGTTRTLTLAPRPMVGHYTYEVRGIRNINLMADMRATLSNMSPSLLLAKDIIPQGISEKLLFGGLAVGNIIKGGFYTFGYSEQSTGNPFLFKLYIKSKAGHTYALEQDVTAQVLSTKVNGHISNVHLIIDLDYEIPDNPISGGDAGFEVDADDWSDVVIDIIV